jgi:hypothetical protein
LNVGEGYLVDNKRKKLSDFLKKIRNLTFFRKKNVVSVKEPARFESPRTPVVSQDKINFISEIDEMDTEKIASIDEISSIEGKDSQLSTKPSLHLNSMEDTQSEIFQGWKRGLFLSFCCAGFILSLLDKLLPAIAEEIIDLDQTDIQSLKNLDLNVLTDNLNPANLPVAGDVKPLNLQLKAAAKVNKPANVVLPIVPFVPVIVKRWTFSNIFGLITGVLTGCTLIYFFRWRNRKRKNKG